MQGKHPNKVRINETGDFFKIKVLKMLNLTSVPAHAEECVWEEIHKVLSIPGKKLSDHLLTSVARQDLCLASILVQAGEVPSQSMIEGAAEGDSRILRVLLRSDKAKISYQALLNAIDGGRKDNVQILMDDSRTPVVPINNQPDLLTTAVKQALGSAKQEQALGSAKQEQALLSAKQEQNNLSILNLLLQDERIDPSGSNNKALYTAAYYNNIPIMKLLINSGANPNLPDSPFVAATVGNLEAVKFLLADPNVDRSKIPVTYLRIVEQNRDPQVTRPNVNKDLPPKNKEDFSNVAKLINSTLYGDKIAGLFLGLHLATSSIDPIAITTELTGKSFNSKLLRYLALEECNLEQVAEWITKNLNDFSSEERQGIIGASRSVLEEEEFSGNVPLAALLNLARGWTFKELYEEVSIENNKNDTYFTCLLLGAYLGLQESLASGMDLPSEKVLSAAEGYTDRTNFAIMRPRS